MIFDDILKGAIDHAIKAREKAVLLPGHTTKVGAAIFTSDGEYFDGWNIQNKCHKSWHAEEIAVLNHMISGKDASKILGIVVTFSKNHIKRLTFCCGFCRQYLWEYTMNPMLEVYEVTLEGDPLAMMRLGDLYPMPYPAEELRMNSDSDSDKVVEDEEEDIFSPEEPIPIGVRKNVW